MYKYVCAEIRARTRARMRIRIHARARTCNRTFILTRLIAITSRFPFRARVYARSVSRACIIFIMLIDVKFLSYMPRENQLPRISDPFADPQIRRQPPPNRQSRERFSIFVSLSFRFPFSTHANGVVKLVKRKSTII